jgi:hypothetical protein
MHIHFDFRLFANCRRCGWAKTSAGTFISYGFFLAPIFGATRLHFHYKTRLCIADRFILGPVLELAAHLVGVRLIRSMIICYRQPVSRPPGGAGLHDKRDSLRGTCLSRCRLRLQSWPEVVDDDVFSNVTETLEITARHSLMTIDSKLRDANFHYQVSNWAPCDGWMLSIELMEFNNEFAFSFRGFETWWVIDTQTGASRFS